MARSPSVPVVLLVLSLLAVAGVAAAVTTPFAGVLTDPAQVSLEIEQPRTAGPNETAATVTFTHTGGDAIPADSVYVVVDGERVAGRENLTLSRSSSTFEIGERIVVEQTGPSGLVGGERVVLVYEHEGTAYRLRAVTVP
ncbi:type IV pilin [Halolamina salina]|uniref:Type IV pilin n=1 Tax=Halolamina salina TaxID=1220023 RepID=A0ABD6B2T3_9EURY